MSYRIQPYESQSPVRGHSSKGSKQSWIKGFHLQRPSPAWFRRFFKLKIDNWYMDIQGSQPYIYWPPVMDQLWTTYGQRKPLIWFLLKFLSFSILSTDFSDKSQPFHLMKGWKYQNSFIQNQTFWRPSAAKINKIF